jgi:hypothetical protein
MLPTPKHGFSPIQLVLRSLLHSKLISQDQKGRPWCIDEKAWNLTPEKEQEIIELYLSHLDK